MVPFRVFDRENKSMWIVLNYHPNQSNDGSYLLAREDDIDTDGEMKIIQAGEIAKYRLVDFIDEADEIQ